jgi:hypothetical protein
VAADGRLAAESAGGGILCLATFDGALELWDGIGDVRLARTALPGITRLLASERGCVALAGGAASRVGLDGRVAVLALEAQAIASARDDVLVGAGDRLRVFDRAGVLRREEAVEPGLSAVARTGDGALVAGFEHGGLEIRRAGAPAGWTILKDTPHARVLQIVDRPPSQLAVAFADGTIGVWSAATGQRLQTFWLHGSATHLEVRGDRLLAVTELGRVGSWDLETYSIPYCRLLRDVWRGVPVIWDAGKAIVRAAPAAHPCAGAP